MNHPVLLIHGIQSNARAHPLAGESLLLDAIATVYLGGTAFKEGEPNLAGTFVGALIIGVLGNGLTLLNVPYYYQNVAKGLVILLAVTITSLQRIKKK
jgi:ribose transport system permease protein